MKTTSVRAAKFQTLLWFGAACFAGAGFYSLWHDSEAPECSLLSYMAIVRNDTTSILNNPEELAKHQESVDALLRARPDDCFRSIRRVNYICLPVAIIMLFSAFTDRQAGERGWLNVGGTLNLHIDKDLQDVVRKGEYGKANIRQPAEIALCCYALGMFVLWYIVSGDSETSLRLASELPLLRGGTLVWLVVVPSACTMYQEYRLLKEKSHIILEKNLHFVGKLHPVRSLLLKLLLAIVSFAVVDPSTQLLFPHVDDTGGQRAIVWISVVLSLLFLLYFWNDYHQASTKSTSGGTDTARSGDALAIDMPFAFNDFSVHLTFVFSIFWGLSGRLQDAHFDNTVNYDFVLQMVYLILATLAAFSIPPSIYFSTKLADAVGAHLSETNQLNTPPNSNNTNTQDDAVPTHPNDAGKHFAI
jgi:hypothetical protein